MSKTESKSIQDKKDREARGSKYQSTFGKEKNTKTKDQQTGDQQHTYKSSSVSYRSPASQPQFDPVQSSQS